MEPHHIPSVASIVTASGIAEEFIAGLLLTCLCASLVWAKGREKAGLVLLATQLSAIAAADWVKGSHPFIKVAFLWWATITATGAVDTFVAPVPDLAYTLCGLWCVAMFGTLAFLWLRRRVRLLVGNGPC